MKALDWRLSIPIRKSFSSEYVWSLEIIILTSQSSRQRLSILHMHSPNALANYLSQVLLCSYKLEDSKFNHTGLFNNDDTMETSKRKWAFKLILV